MKKIFNFFVLGILLAAFNMSAQSVYVLNANSKLEPVTRAVTTGNRISGKALLSAYGAKLTTNLVIDGKRAELTLPMGANYFYVQTPVSIPIKSWKLAPLKNGKKNTRELPYSKSGVYSGTTTSIDEVELRVEKISDEIYRLYPVETLSKGEYAFFRLEAGVPAEVYDFRVDASLSPALNIPTNDIVLAQLTTGEKVPSSVVPVKNDNLAENDKKMGSKTRQSDVDINIPKTKAQNNNTFVLIIANEDYTFVDNVEFALNDGNTFKEYCAKTLGIPERQIWLYENASLGVISSGVNKLVRAMNTFEDGKAIIYYCGHGIPDEKTGDAYIIPVDGNGTDVTSCYSLNRLYKTMAEANASNVTYFMDACFTGANRNGSMLVAARGVAREPKKEVVEGNTIVFSAASGDETAMPFREKQHGLFTYFLLKKLQETKGNVTYGDLAKYINDNVKREAFLTNDKPQTPVVATSESLASQWKNVKMK